MFAPNMYGKHLGNLGMALESHSLTDFNICFHGKLVVIRTKASTICSSVQALGVQRHSSNLLTFLFFCKVAKACREQTIYKIITNERL